MNGTARTSSIHFLGGRYGIIIHDGGGSFYEINFCPWCGKRTSEYPPMSLWFYLESPS